MSQINLSALSQGPCPPIASTENYIKKHKMAQQFSIDISGARSYSEIAHSTYL